MADLHRFDGGRNVSRASRAWWLRRIRAAAGLVGFAIAMVVWFFTATTSGA